MFGAFLSSCPIYNRFIKSAPVQQLRPVEAGQRVRVHVVALPLHREEEGPGPEVQRDLLGPGAGFTNETVLGRKLRIKLTMVRPIVLFEKTAM
jgi:hypothetical protein